MIEESYKVPLLPPQLEVNMKQYDIEMPPFYPVYDRVLIYPVEVAAGQPDTTKAGLVIPEYSKKRANAQTGVLIAAGVKAREQLYSHGIELGDVVVMARFSHWERNYFGASGNPHRVYILQAGEIVGSVGLKHRLDRNEIWMEMDRSGKVLFHERERNDPPQIDLGDGV